MIFLKLLSSSFVDTEEIDWDKAVRDGHTSYAHDFSKFSQEPNGPGKVQEGTTGTLSTKV